MTDNYMLIFASDVSYDLLRNEVLTIQLGELLCESLVNAEDAPTLQFAVGPDEVRYTNA